MLRREMTATHHHLPHPGIAHRYGLPAVREIHRVTAHPVNRSAHTPARAAGDRRSTQPRVAPGD